MIEVSSKIDTTTQVIADKMTAQIADLKEELMEMI